ncbi:MAG TPA: zinc ribbon domain-containing protein [Chloroflexota bacterium]|nr:zinc ribbon domain-containing protein [Chloroflexota bacterium]
MPVYEYYCRQCDTKFEKLQPMSASAEPAVCPECHAGALRTLSVIAGRGHGDDGIGAGGCACGGACSCA